MTEISLNILDVAQNSIKAEATLVTVTVRVDPKADRLAVTIADDGCGMDGEQLKQVEDPFFTTRTTRKVGLGIPFFKYAAESTGGTFRIASQPGQGTTVEAVFVLSHIDRMPMGDLNGTIETLIRFNTHTEFVFEYQYDENRFTLDTRQLKEILGDIPLDVPEVTEYIHEYLHENKFESDGGAVI